MKTIKQALERLREGIRDRWAMWVPKDPLTDVYGAPEGAWKGNEEG